MTPAQINDEWFVVSGDQQLAGPFKSNGEARRWIDRQEGDVVSKAEERSEWLTKKILGGA